MIGRGGVSVSSSNAPSGGAVSSASASKYSVTMPDRTAAGDVNELGTVGICSPHDAINTAAAAKARRGAINLGEDIFHS